MRPAPAVRVRRPARALQSSEDATEPCRGSPAVPRAVRNAIRSAMPSRMPAERQRPRVRRRQLDGEREPVGEPADLGRGTASVSGPDGRSGCTCRRARSSSSAAPSPVGSSPASGSTASPARPSVTRLVASIRSDGQWRSRSRRPDPRPPARRCSQLSSTSRPPARPSRSRSSSIVPRPGSSGRPHASSTARAMSDWPAEGRGELDEPVHRSAPGSRELDREAGLPAAARPDHRHQPFAGVSSASRRARPPARRTTTRRPEPPATVGGPRTRRATSRHPRGVAGAEAHRQCGGRAAHGAARMD